MTLMARLSDIDGVAARARHLFGPAVAIGARDPRSDPAPLWCEEEPAIRHAIPSRCREFANGRMAARHAMDQLGLPACGIPAGEDRAPVWPAELVGSLSHSSTACIAALALRRDLRAVGVDIESADPLEDDLVPTVCTASERAWLNGHPSGQRGTLAKLIFSAKECAYKCQYPLTRQVFGFDTLTIRPGMDKRRGGVFDAYFTRRVGTFARGHRLSGRFAMDAGFIVTAMVLGHDVPGR